MSGQSLAVPKIWILATAAWFLLPPPPPQFCTLMSRLSSISLLLSSLSFVQEQPRSLAILARHNSHGDQVGLWGVAGRSVCLPSWHLRLPGIGWWCFYQMFFSVYCCSPSTFLSGAHPVSCVFWRLKVLLWKISLTRYQTVPTSKSALSSFFLELPSLEVLSSSQPPSLSVLSYSHIFSSYWHRKARLGLFWSYGTEHALRLVPP